ncbi:hypothetical protein [Terriglobus aquaticus]|uniref:DUF4126 domain-containing protein n=1 Tax=Terriglobus aquaticus TaxID=940139 RepID=A0ABW9KNU4_9BACT|nr:hypothetical protein [Terriglobus aquaticus]
MQNAPAYSADRFPGDFSASALCAAVTASVTGPVAWWLARRYMLCTYPNHPEMLGAAVLTGILDGLLIACIAFGICFAARVWIYERRERKQSDAALRDALSTIDRERKRGTGGEPPIPRQ